VSDVVFVLVVIAFFAIAVLAVRGCALVIGRDPMLEDDRRA
jgi:hypothetical protein